MNSPSYNYDWWKYDKDLMLEFNWFLRKINQRACIERSFITEEYESVRRDGSNCFGLHEDVEYFHPTITLDDRMRFIGTVISQLDMSFLSILGNTLISHFYGARGVHEAITQTPNGFVDFDRALSEPKYLDELRRNVLKAKASGQPIWGTTELHTSIQTASRNFCRSKYADPNRPFNTIDVIEWVASFEDNGTVQGLLDSDHLNETYKILKKLPGIGDYYGFHAATSTSVLPQLKYHHDQRFVAPGPGAVWTIKQLWPDVPNKHLAEAVYFLRENADAVGLTDGVKFHPDAYNIMHEGKGLFKDPQDSLKYYGTEVLCCQFGVYMQIRDDEKRSQKRRVARAKTSNTLANFL